MQERLNLLIEQLGLSQKDFAEGLGLKSAFISDLLNGRAKSFSQDSLSKLHQKYGINVNWLLSGYGEMFISSVEGHPRTQASPNPLAELDKESRKLVEGLVHVLVERKVSLEPKGHLIVTDKPIGAKPEQHSHAEFMEMTEWDGSVAAGRLGQEELKPIGKIRFPRKLIPERGPFHILRVRGDSMEGADIHDGDRAIFRPVNDPHRLKPGSIVIVLVDGENTLKRLFIEDHGATLRAENPKYQDIRVNKLQDLIIQGELVYILKKVND